MQNNMINISVDELDRLKQRAKKLAEDKSYQQLVMQLMTKISEVSGLDNVIDNMLHCIVDVIGGANAMLYYKIDDDIFYADLYGIKKHLSQIDDEQINVAFASGEPSEYEHDFSDTQMLTPAFTHAYTWVYPLKIGNKIIGVFEIQSLHIAMRDLAKQLPLFFNYAALVLKNEILGYTRLQLVNKQLQQEIFNRKQTEQALLAAKEAAETASRAKSIFLANMSHELRTPMNAVLGFSQLMQKDPDLSPAQRENLNIINNSGNHLLTLINEVLDMAKIEAGKISIENSNFDLGTLITETIDMMRERAQSKGLELLIDSSSSFPRFINSDEFKLRQILLNLIGNAIKYTNQGSISVQLTTQALDNEQQCLLIFAIQDTGIGIAEQDLPLVFDTFVQVGDESAQQGSGLGLPIAQQYAHLMGGDIQVSSELGKGSLFILTLPINRVEQSEIISSLTGKKLQVGGLAAHQPHYRVLIAEDQLENRLLLKNILVSVGFQVREANNGQEAIEQFIHWQPHFIWMDRRMPVIDGIEATRQIRALPNGKDVKIVAVTASVFLQQRQEFLDAGANDIISKPYREAQIFDCMESQLGVQFIYDSTIEHHEQKKLTPVNASQVSNLPNELRLKLQAATTSLDLEQSAAVIDAISEIDAPLAKALFEHLEQFDFEAITKLF